jgi:hypothetical protein
VIPVCVCVRALEFGGSQSGVAEDSGLLGRDTVLSGKWFVTFKTKAVSLPYWPYSDCLRLKMTAAHSFETSVTAAECDVIVMLDFTLLLKCASW